MITIVNCLIHHGDIRRSPNCAIKGLILILRIFQFGPVEVLKGARESSSCLVFVDNLCGYWAAKQAEAAWEEAERNQSEMGKIETSEDKLTCLLIARLASLVSMRIRFHARHPEFSSHYTSQGEDESVPPKMPRLFTVKSVSALLDLGGGCDAVCDACMSVIEKGLEVRKES